MTCRRCSEPAAVQLHGMCPLCAVELEREATALLVEEWKAHSHRIEHERDEARAEVERLRKQADAWRDMSSELGTCEDPNPCGICEPCLDALPPVDTSRWCPATYRGHQCHRDIGHEGKHYVGAHGSGHEWTDPEPGE